MQAAHAIFDAGVLAERKRCAAIADGYDNGGAHDMSAEVIAEWIRSDKDISQTEARELLMDRFAVVRKASEAS